jgi:UDP-N-acetylmuramate dehydrogenase
MIFSETLHHIIRENEPLAPYCWLRIGGPAKYFAEPTTLEELGGLVREASAAGMSVRILGGGSNLLVREPGVDGLVISLGAPDFAHIRVQETRVIVGTGAKLGHLISRAVGAGLAGLEHLVGIPGTVGGAVVGNAGVINDDLGNHVVAATVMERTGEVRRLEKSSLQFAFRRSNLDDAIVCEVELELEKGSEQQLTRRMQSNWIIKRANQPSTDLRAVLAFVEPSVASIGELFEAAGVKGTAEGEASLSAPFPGYILVSGAATSDQVLALIARVRRTVEMKTGIALQSQLRIW